MAGVRRSVVQRLMARYFSNKWQIAQMSACVNTITVKKGATLHGIPPVGRLVKAENRTLSSKIQNDLAGKTALVSGSTAGIGLGVADNLAKQGVNIIITGLGDPGHIKHLVSDIERNRGVKTDFIGAQLDCVEDINRLCESVIKLYPNGIDILINNAGLQHVCEVESFPTEKWDLLIAVMLSSPFHLIRQFLPAMKKQGWGRIINLASVHGLVASPFKSAYCSAKHGLLGLTKVVALETAGSGVTCNAICPGYVDTELFQIQIRQKAASEGVPYEEAEERFLAKYHPTKHAVEVSQVADFVSFVCSRSADQMTGSILTMDSGWTAH